MLAGLAGILFSVLSILLVTISFPMSMETEFGVSSSNFQRLNIFPKELEDYSCFLQLKLLLMN